MSARLSFSSACLFVCISAARTGRMPVKFDIEDQWKSIEKIQMSLKLDKNVGHLTRRPQVRFNCRRRHKFPAILLCNTRYFCVVDSDSRIVAFPMQQWLHKRATVSRHTYIAHRVNSYATWSFSCMCNWMHCLCYSRFINVVLVLPYTQLTTVFCAQHTAFFQVNL